eukprot:6008352-Karenia_brevis.AAC.1
MKHCLADLDSLNPQHSSECLNTARKLLGKIRFMPKVHKLSSHEECHLTFRRIEADTKNCLSSLAQWLAALLELVVRSSGTTNIPDSSFVTASLNNQKIKVEPGKFVFAIASDINDYFPSLDLDIALPVVKSALIRYFGQSKANFIF